MSIFSCIVKFSEDILIAAWYSVLWLYHTVISHVHVDDKIDYFSFFTVIKNRAVIRIYPSIYFCSFHISNYFLKTDCNEKYWIKKKIPNIFKAFDKVAKLISRSLASAQSHQQCLRMPVSRHSKEHKGIIPL